MNLQIKGSCVTREAINYWASVFPDKEPINVDYYMFQKPIAAIASKPIELPLQLIDKVHAEMINSRTMRDFAIKQFSMSLNKAVVKKEVNHGFYIIDLIDERMSLYEYNDTLLEYREEIERVLKSGRRINNSLGIFCKYIDIFINKLREFYKDENIILHKAYAVYSSEVAGKKILLEESLQDENPRYSQYTYKEAILRNKNLAIMYNYIEKNYPNIKVIELEYGKYISPINHRYGRGYYHYNDEYYIDFIKKLNSIFENEYDIDEYNNIRKNNWYQIVKQVKGLEEINNKIELLNEVKKNFITEIADLEKKIFDFSEKDKDISYKDENQNQLALMKIKEGKVQQHSLFITESRLENIIEYFEDGRIKALNVKLNGDLLNKFLFNKQGYVTSHISYIEKKKNKEIKYGNYCKIGTVESITEYFDNGDKRYFGMNYGNGFKRSRTYYRDGKIYDFTEIYDSNGELKEVRYYDNDNSRLNDIIFNEGVKHKSIEYFKDGKVKRVTVYNSKGEIIEESYREDSSSTLKIIKHNK